MTGSTRSSDRFAVADSLALPLVRVRMRDFAVHRRLVDAGGRDFADRCGQGDADRAGHRLYLEQGW